MRIPLPKRFIVVKYSHKNYHVGDVQYEVDEEGDHKDVNLWHELEPFKIVVVVKHEVVEKAPAYSDSFRQCQ